MTHTELLNTLTPRERQTLILTAKGIGREAAGKQLGIAKQTVDHYLCSIRDKLGVTTIEAAVLAAKAGWV